MGGLALGYEAFRADAEQYSRIVKDFEYWMEENIPNWFTLGVIPSYKTKPSFGDADIVIQCFPQVWEYIITTLGNQFEHKKNGNVFSFGWKTSYSETPFQIDLIFTGSERSSFIAAFDYFSYNDCGNLVGRLAHRCGFKYGHRGLTYVLRDPLNYSNVIEEIVVSQDTKEIHEFLDLKHEKFKEGFQTLEEMFLWVSSSRYFDPDIYLLDNVNAVSRIRDRKRKTYTYFLEWCAGSKFDYFKLNRDQVGILRSYKLAEVLKKDHELSDNFNCLNFEFQKSVLAKQFFNGDLVREWTGLEGKELGQFMKENKFSSNDVLENMHRMKEIVLNKIESIKNEN